MALGQRYRLTRAARLLPMACMAALAACSDVRTTPDLPARDVYRQIGDVDLSPRTPLRATAGGPVDSPTPRAAAYVGQAEAFGAAPAPGGGVVTDGAPAAGTAPAVDGGQGFQFSFENAPIPSVVKSVLADTLGLSYELDPRVQGNLSLSFGRPLNRQQVLFALENALRTANATMVRDATGYRILPAQEAIGEGASDGHSVEPGYGLSVFPLRYVTAATMAKLLDGFAAKPGAIRVDGNRNLLLIAGTGPERAAAMQTAASFDADFMRGQSVGIYPLRNATPKPVIAELENIMQPSADPQDQTLIKFQPVDRLNAVLVVTRRTDLLAKAASWIGRLDRTDSSANGIKVYRVRYGEAKHIATVLNAMFSGSSAADTTNQTAPGSGSQTSRTDALGGLSALGGAGGGANTAGAGGFGAGTANVGVQAGGQGGSGNPFGALTNAGLSGSRNGGGGGADQGTADAAQGQQSPIAGVRITADPVTNSLLIFASRENYKTIERALIELDRPPLQVAIEATIAEVTLNNNLNYGVQYFLQSKEATAVLGTQSLVNNALASTIPGANLLLGPNSNPRIVLDALRAYTDVKVISSPSLVVLDNEVATLQVGDSVPVSTSSATLVSAATSTSTASVGFPVANTIDYRNTGVILRVLPRVNYNGNVSLDVEQEISSIVPSATADTLTPTISERKIKSSIAVASEQTVLLAGLISDTQNSTRSGLPIVERLQGIGDLFSSNSRAHSRTELIIFIRPRIIRDGNDAADVAEALRGRILSSTVPQPARSSLVRRF